MVIALKVVVHSKVFHAVAGKKTCFHNFIIYEINITIHYQLILRLFIIRMQITGVSSINRFLNIISEMYICVRQSVKENTKTFMGMFKTSP